jgi:coiled-coil domain-containing protein 64
VRQVSVCEVELQAALEERDRARNDASHSSLAQEDVVVRAREDRDLAIQRKTKAEVELAKTRVELMQANSQLLEAIQQKVELSQQLEQWQMDMQELLDEQLKSKLTSQEMTMKQIVQTPVAPPRRRLLSFFLR